MSERKIPGTIPSELREYRYISGDGKSDFSKIFKQLMAAPMTSKASSGGAIVEYCRITLPDHCVFYGVSYKGDIEGWRQDIEEGARALRLLVAKIENEKVVVCDGRSFALANCSIEFY